MKRAILPLLVCGVFFSFLGCATAKDAAQEKGRFFETEGGYSICVPELWQTAELPGLKYKILAGQSENGFTTNIVFADEAFGGDLDMYVDAAIQQLQKLLGENVEIVSTSDFVTLKNLKGVKIVANTFQYNLHLQQNMYVFPGEGKKLVMTATTLKETGEAYDSLFDETAATFMWEQK